MRGIHFHGHPGKSQGLQMMNTAQAIAISGTMNACQSINTSMISDGNLTEPSSPESTFDESDLLSSSVTDDVTAQLANAGTIGIAAAAAIASGKKRKRPHSFETNPSVRKRQQTRLLRKLRTLLDEYTTRVGQQAAMLCCTPGKTQHVHSFRVFGSQPLENVLRGRRSEILQDLEACLQQQMPPQQPDNPALHELPPLNIDGIPTPVDKMTQSQLRSFIPLMLKYSSGRGKPGWGREEYRPPWWPLDVPWANVRSDVRVEEEKQKAQLRAFIPEMLKYSTGRSKPGWGKPECRPIWWPEEVPWANVRSDVRSEDEKKQVSWTHALRTIVRNCYKHHGREDLMPKFQEDSAGSAGARAAVQAAHAQYHQTMVQTINNPDGTVSVIQIDTGESGTPQIITLADGTQAQVVHTLPNGLHHHQHEATQAVQTLAEVASGHNDAMHNSVGIEMSDGSHTTGTLAEATLNHEGQLILTGDPTTLDGTIKQEVNLGQGDNKMGQIIGMVTIPVSMYQAVVTSLPQLAEVQQAHNLSAGGMVITPQQLAAASTVNADGTPHHQLHIESQEDDMDDSQDDIKPVLHDCTATGQQSGHPGDVPDATHAVEIMTVEQS